MFITIDGGDGSGKSTQVKRLAEYLRQRGKEPLICRDPGSTPLGEAVRRILLDRQMTISASSEMFLFMAARAQMTAELIRPALDAGKIVLSDRFLLSTLVYQGFAPGFPPDPIFETGLIAIEGRVPDLTILLDIDPERAFSRLNRPLDRMEAKGLGYHRRVRTGFRDAALYWEKKTGRPTAVIDASEPADTVTRRIIEKVEPLLAAE